MPGKFAALRFADERTARAELVGSANTLVRTPARLAGRQHRRRRRDGCAGARCRAGRSCWARAAPRRPPSSGWPSLACNDITVVARNRDKAAPAAGRSGPGSASDVRWIELGDDAGRTSTWSVSTIPADVAAGYADTVAATPVLLDAIYDPWPTPLAAAVERRGRPGDQRAADAAAPGVRAGRAVHRAARAHRGDEGRAERTVVFDR